MPFSLTGSRKKLSFTSFSEVTPGQPGGSYTFADRVFGMNAKLSGIDLMARDRKIDRILAQMPLETYETVEVAAFSHDALWLLYGAFTLRLVSVTNGDVKELLPLGLGLGTDVQWGQSPPRLHSCAFGADSELCCASRGEELLVFDLTTRSMLCCLRGADAHLISCALTARHMAQVAAAGVSAAGAIFLWRDLGSHGALPPLRIDASPIGVPQSSGIDMQCLVFSSNRLLCGGATGLFLCWDGGSKPAAENDNNAADPSEPTFETTKVTPMRLGEAIGITAIEIAFPRVEPLNGLEAALGAASLDGGGEAGVAMAPLMISAAPSWDPQPPRSYNNPFLEGDRTAPLILCCEANGWVHVRDARSGASLSKIHSGGGIGDVRWMRLGRHSGRTLLTLKGFADASVFETSTSCQMQSEKLGPALGIAGWLSRVAAIGLAPDDSCLIGLSVTRHGGTGLFVIRLEDVSRAESAI